MQVGRMFGTDGVRGVANEGLTPELAFYLGRAFAGSIKQANDTRGPIIIGRDTRKSGTMLEAALVAGITSAGIDVWLVGEVPTPGVAYLIRHCNAVGGVMVSASHNPAPDNGIKFFGADSFKLNDNEENSIEAIVHRLTSGDDPLPRPIGGDVGRAVARPDLGEKYGEYLLSTVELDLSGRRVVLDCAHGAAFALAPNVFKALGADVISLHTEPNGVNINVNCGSTHIAALQQAVLEHKADVGFAFDGDADRVIAVDETGAEVDGDHILAFCGRYLIETGRLPHNQVAATVYSNLGLQIALEAAGGSVVTTQAGDRYVLEAMRERGLVLGGEQSGHIIFAEYNTTGDGILTALQVAQVMDKRGKKLSELAAEMKPLPQVLKNVAVQRRDGWETNASIQEAIRAAEERFEGHGRIFVRPSGTEPVIRVMGEGPEYEQVAQAVEDVCAVIRRELA